MLRLLVATLVFLGSIHCGDDGFSSGIDASVFPDQPTIRHNTATLNADTDSEQIINPPWFRFIFQLDNNTGENIFLTGFSMKTRGLKDGNSVESEFDISFEDLGESDVDEIQIANGGNFRPESYIYISGLPDSRAEAVDSDFFRVTIEVEGYAGDDSLNSTENFVKTFSFSTTGL